MIDNQEQLFYTGFEDVIILKKEIVKTEMKVKDTFVGIMRVGNVDYISLTDLAKYQNEKDPSGVIRNWMSNKNSFEFYSLWEELHNENFNSVESHRIKKEWKDKNPNLNGNMRDYVSILQLVILINLENLNAEMINQGLAQSKRLERLNEIAKKQLTILQDSSGIKKIESLEDKNLLSK